MSWDKNWLTRGSIPALAGEPGLNHFIRAGRTVYPRACGGTATATAAHTWVTGLSPRLRGNRHCHRRPYLGHRSIPALAGEPLAWVQAPQPPRVYPRACGGTRTDTTGEEGRTGLSPRLRGNQLRFSISRVCLRSIPALAGEPNGELRVWFLFRVYPRACGGPEPHHPTPRLASVYPRACGGTFRTAFICGHQSGLSPRLRGNRFNPSMVALRVGSIPALAGEPVTQRTRLDLREVYPRACGGTEFDPRGDVPLAGLSPRLRGNPTKYPPSQVRQRSIPALAGEPRAGVRIRYRDMVYPRACGGTAVRQHEGRRGPGLSPRLRGNPLRYPQARRFQRSIPALAGEPCGCPAQRPIGRVYPRACGGTTLTTVKILAHEGLSPRLRGNRWSCE